MNDFGSQLGTALHDRVADVRLDLDQLVATSVRAGSRIRMRRRLGVSLAAAAGVAVVAVGGVQMAGGGTQAVDGGMGSAAEPTASSTPTTRPAVPGTHVKAPSGADVGFMAFPGLAGRPATMTALLVADHPNSAVARTDKAWILATYSNVTKVATTNPDAVKRATEPAPFRVTAPGWTCTVPGDEKFDCTKGAESVHLAWRDASSHADYANGTVDKSADWVGDVHHGVFVTIDGRLAGQVGESITWVS